MRHGGVRHVPSRQARHGLIRCVMEGRVWFGEAGVVGLG